MYTFHKTAEITTVPQTSQYAMRAHTKGFAGKKALWKPKPTLYLFVFISWLVSVWHFAPRLGQLLEIASTPVEWGVLAFFVVFMQLAWLYGFYNIGVILFAGIYRRWFAKAEKLDVGPVLASAPPVAILYTTCNDFVEKSAESCVRQDYKNFHVYILDDSSDSVYQCRVDHFAASYPDRVTVVRRGDRKGFKAGNMNNALANAVNNEPYFAIADADEILPPDFLLNLVPHLEADSSLGFVQANHRSNPDSESSLAKSLGAGIDSHWKWYQPLRNRYGFVMFLGHGAILRRKCWEVIGGFPEIVSEDLAFAMRIRERGWHGKFVEDVVCYEDFPETVRAFRVRHMKWTRGTCEFLRQEGWKLLRNRRISWPEKFDILFPTLNLPLTLLYFLFMINANMLIPAFFGTQRPMTMVFAGSEYVVPIYTLSEGFNVIYSHDFFIVTLITLLAPVLCFVIDMIRKPLFLARFLCHSTAVYASLGPLSSLGVLSYMLTGKATFLVTGDQKSGAVQHSGKGKWRSHFSALLTKSHPDQFGVQAFEVMAGLVFAVICVMMMQVSFLGLSLAFMLMPVMHHYSWTNSFVQFASYVPFVLIMAGIGLGVMALFGMPTLFFAFGFHF